MRIDFANLTTAAVAAGLYLFAGTGCANAPEPEDTTQTNVDVNTVALGSALPSCSTAGSSGFDSGTSTLTLTLTAGVPDIMVQANAAKVLLVNGNVCVDGSDVALTTTTVKKIVVTGTSADESVVFDASAGSFGTIFSATGGVKVDMVSGTDSFGVRGSNTVLDKFTAGEDNSIVYFEMSGDKTADIKVENADSFTVALGDGNDTFSGAGGAISAVHLTTGVTTLTACTVDLTINGGAGNDTITGGDGDDTINGGEGDDTFKAAAIADGADVFNGGAGTDTADYSARTGDLTITLDGTNNDGLALETDDIKADVENVTGGAGDDTITGSTLSNVLTGGAGDDTLNGGTGNGDCALDSDTLNGGDGDDTFTQGNAADCGDAMAGGAGTDTVTYTARSNDLFIDIDGTADDGESGEKDNVKTDIEKVIGGAGNDTITGSANADIIDGGAGDDILSGGAGDDTFLEGAADSGADTMNGGNGFDTIDYSGRSAAQTMTLCVSTTLTGASADCTAADDGVASEGDEIINCEHILGGTDVDTMTCDSVACTLEGDDGNDILTGGSAADTIYGDDGDDVIVGGAGDDTLDGGPDTADGNQEDDTIDGGAGDGDYCTAATNTNCEFDF